MRVHERYREREAYFSFDAFRYGACALETYASRARSQYGPIQFSEEHKIINSGIAQPSLNHGWPYVAVAYETRDLTRQIDIIRMTSGQLVFDSPRVTRDLSRTL